MIQRTFYSGNQGTDLSEKKWTFLSALDTSECEALKSLYISTNGNNWTNSTGWLVSNDPCTWSGLTCSNGQISAIDLGNNHLVGDFNGVFNGFSNLAMVDLYDNEIYGDFGEIVDLLPLGISELYLGGNRIGGDVPAALLNFSQLEWLNLTDNLISGDIVDVVNNLPGGLRGIWLDLNYLDGTIPATISKFNNLIALDLSYNLLDGDWITIQGALPHGMAWIGLGYTNLSGTIPESLAANNPDLLVLDLSYNYLGGNLSLSIGDLEWLDILVVNYNLLKGPIPASYPNLWLETFYYDNTTICEPTSSEMQTWLTGITDLRGTGIACEKTPPSVTIFSPSSGSKIHQPKSQILVNATDSQSGMSRVEFFAYYNSVWNYLDTDSEESDEWSCVWLTYAVPIGPIKIKAVGYDHHNNLASAQIDNLQLTNGAIINIGGYEAREGNGEQTIGPAAVMVDFSQFTITRTHLRRLVLQFEPIYTGVCMKTLVAERNNCVINYTK